MLFPTSIPIIQVRGPNHGAIFRFEELEQPHAIKLMVEEMGMVFLGAFDCVARCRKKWHDHKLSVEGQSRAEILRRVGFRANGIRTKILFAKLYMKPLDFT